MPLAQHTPSPAALANAKAMVNVTSATTCNPAIIGGAWATLKAARGQHCNFDILATPAHLILSAPAPALPEAPADLHQARIAARIRRRIALMNYGPHGGDAA